MKRILMVLTVALIMAAMVVVSVAPAFAVSENAKGPQNPNSFKACTAGSQAFFCPTEDPA